MAYDHRALEERWQKYWETNQTFRAERRLGRPKAYVLDMFARKHVNGRSALRIGSWGWVGGARKEYGGVRVTGWERIGNYAIRFDFSDGHRTGLYSYELLRQLGAAAS